jgi:hypothetical protein
MESVYHIVAVRVNETTWAHVCRLRSRYLGTGYDSKSSLTLTLALKQGSKSNMFQETKNNGPHHMIRLLQSDPKN